MSEHITSEEARALLAAALRVGDWYQVIEPDGDDDNGPDGGDYPTRHVYCEGEPVADCDTAAIAVAVASLPRVVAALAHAEKRRDHWIEAATGARAEVAALRAERDRLARVLAVERGHGSHARPGWESRGADMWVRVGGPGRVVIQRWHRDGQSTEWLRRGEIDGARWPTALEAMEALDAEVSDAPT